MGAVDVVAADVEAVVSVAVNVQDVVVFVAEDKELVENFSIIVCVLCLRGPRLLPPLFSRAVVS